MKTTDVLHYPLVAAAYFWLIAATGVFAGVLAATVIVALVEATLRLMPVRRPIPVRPRR